MNTARPLRRQLHRVLYLCALSAFLVSGLVAGWLKYQTELDQYAKILHGQLQVIRMTIPQRILKYDTFLQEMIRTLPDAGRETMLSTISRQLRSHDPLDLYYILDVDGTIIQISEKYANYLHFNPSGMPHVQEAKKISRVFQSIFSGHPAVALLYPLPGGLRLIYERDTRTLVSLLDALEQGNILPEQEFFILSAEGVAVYHPDQSLAASRANLAFELKEITPPDRYGMQSYRYRDRTYLTLTKKLEIPEGWTAYLQIPSALLYTTIIRSASLIVTGVFLLLTAIILLIQYALNRSFSTPVREMVSALTSYRDETGGPVFADDDVFPIEEFNRIARAINQMALALTATTGQLRQSETHIRLLLDSTAEAIFGVDLEGRCTFCNAAFLRITGFTAREEVVGKAIHPLVHHRDSDFCRIQQACLLGRECHSEDEIFLRADGSTLPVAVWSHPIPGANGPAGAVVTFLDISARKQAEKERNAAFDRFRLVMDSLDALVYVADMATHELLFLNRYGRERWGDGIGLPCWQVLQTGQSGPCPFCSNDRLLGKDGKAGEVYVWEFQNTVTGRWYECRDQAIPWTDSRLVRMEIAVDITPRKDAERALEAEKERLAVTLRSIGDGVITTDTEGRVVLMNTVAEQLTGWKQQEGRGRPLTEVFHIINEKTRMPVDNPVDKVLASGKIVGLANHTLLIARDGRERNIADSGAPIRDRESRPIGVVLVFRDVTEQSRMEEERLKMKKLESVGLLAGGIAHDFNNILVAILGNLNLAQLDQDLADKTRELLAAAEKASIRARDLTRQLLTFAKGGYPVRETASIAETIMDSAGFVLSGSTVSCDYQLPRDLWLVDIDKGQMSQVIQNIILNAKHAMPQGGTIHVCCENVEEHHGMGRAVKITISDSGIGIPTELLDRVFDPYFTTKQEGSGLGLAITYSIINKHNGMITVSSEPGKGTAFTIFLPASPEEAEEVLARKPLAAGGKTARILIMDDEEMVQQVASAMLAYLGYDVLQAWNGAEALDLYQKSQSEGKAIDLVIMDLTIPGGMGGKEAIRELLAIDPEARVLVASGYSNDPIMSRCREYGFLEAVIKPFELEELASAVDRALEATRP